MCDWECKKACKIDKYLDIKNMFWKMLICLIIINI